jgi:hypothetical protein
METAIGETIPGPTLWLHISSTSESVCRETLTNPFELIATM